MDFLEKTPQVDLCLKDGHIQDKKDISSGRYHVYVQPPVNIIS